MPYARAADHRKANAASMRRRRLFLAAVLAGHPKAVEAERRRSLSDGLADSAKDLDLMEYRRLRAEVVAEALRSPSTGSTGRA